MHKTQRHMFKRVSSIFLFALLAVFVTGCAATDVILNYAPGSLDQIIETSPSLVSSGTQDNQYFVLSLDGETKLNVSRDYSLSKTEDVAIQTPLKPFVDAGLNPALLTSNYRADETSLFVIADFGSGSGEKSTFTSALFEGVQADRSILGYHADLDHFGIQLPGGKFEWAKDPASNDKDIVFVIAAKPLADLGVDVQNVEGWTFMTMKDDAGMDFDVLLKPYSLGA